MTKPWYLYIVKCRDDSLYTGITTDIMRRIAQHNSGKGAKYTRSRRPVTLVFSKEYKDRSAASKAEYYTKRLSRKEKIKMIDQKGKP